MKIAIIGSGISGLTAAFRLGQRHQVTLLEQNDYLGGHAHTVDVTLDGQQHAIDTGFIVFNDRNYPRFVELLDELGVGSRATSMSFSVRCQHSGFEYNGSSLAGLFAQKRNLLRPGFYRMLRDIARFNRCAPDWLAANAGQADADHLTVGKYLTREHYSNEFARYYLLAMGSAIWSCPIGKFEQFPLRFVIEFFQHHGLLQLTDRPTWRVVEGGSRAYVTALRAKLNGRVRLSTRVTSVRRLPHQVEIRTDSAPAEHFDQVVFACHSDQALRMLADPSPVERELLRAFPYERSVALLHTDIALLPRRRRAWASWNYFVSDTATSAIVTYCMNILQHVPSRQVVNVTLNAEDRIDPRRVLGRFEYEHPLFTTGRAAAQARHAELINVNRSSFCGAYWRNGFHEDGVVSALAVCAGLDSTSSSEHSPGELAPAGSQAYA